MVHRSQYLRRIFIRYTPMRLLRFWFAPALALLVAVAAAFSGAAPAWARYVLPTRTDPPAGAVLSYSPSSIVAWFPEELVVGKSSLKVYDAQGKQVDNQRGGVDIVDSSHMVMQAPMPRLPKGVYTVQWTATLTDGEVSQGSYQFSLAQNGQPRYSPSYPGYGPSYPPPYPLNPIPGGYGGNREPDMDWQ
jgi:methionine-rich copper-binding protein CopC